MRFGKEQQFQSRTALTIETQRSKNRLRLDPTQWIIWRLWTIQTSQEGKSAKEESALVSM
jgi:thiamine kinase-like enzyme